MNNTELDFSGVCQVFLTSRPDTPRQAQERPEGREATCLEPLMRAALDWSQHNRARRRRLGLE